MKRWALRIFVFLLLGAIVNVAVAWGCARWIQAHSSSETLPTAAEMELIANVGEAGTAYGMLNTGIGVEKSRILLEDDYAFQQMMEAEEKAFRERGAIVCYGVVSSPFVEIHSVGWPFKALRGSVCVHSKTYFRDRGIWSMTPKVETRTAVVIGRRPTGDMFEPASVILPFGALVPGFAINTLFYAAILWLLVAAPFALRRRRRIKRGLCPKCAYPMGASEVCTECGSVVQR